MISEESIDHLNLKKDRILISTIILIAANLIPIIGILFLQWDPKYVIILYWAESAIIGILNIAKMLMTGFHSNALVLIFAIFLSGFFLIHYGGFMTGHGVFLSVILFGGLSGTFNPPDAIPLILKEISFRTPGEFFNSEFLGFVLLIISHTASYILYFLKDKEYEGGHVKLVKLMFAPYQRIIIMQVVIIFGTFIVMSVKGGAAHYFFLLIALKIIFDVRAHIKERVNPTNKKEDSNIIKTIKRE